MCIRDSVASGRHRGDEVAEATDEARYEQETEPARVLETEHDGQEQHQRSAEKTGPGCLAAGLERRQRRGIRGHEMALVGPGRLGVEMLAPAGLEHGRAVGLLCY